VEKSVGVHKNSDASNNMVVVPTTMAGSHFTNFSPFRDLAVLVEVVFTTTAIWITVEQITVEVATEVMRKVRRVPNTSRYSVPHVRRVRINLRSCLEVRSFGSVRGET